MILKFFFRSFNGSGKKSYVENDKKKMRTELRCERFDRTCCGLSECHEKT